MSFSLSLLAISLSLDAFCVGFIYEIKKIKIPTVSKIIICFFSIIYASIALILGSSLSKILSPVLSKYFGIGILLVIGVIMILKSIIATDNTYRRELKNFNTKKTLLEIGIKSLGLSIQIIKNPIEGDIDDSGVIDIKESVLLGLALSVDAIGVVLGSTLAGFFSRLIPIAIGFSQMFFLYIGFFCGEKLSNKLNLNQKLVSILPGILLIILALIRL